MSFGISPLFHWMTDAYKSAHGKPSAFRDVAQDSTSQQKIFATAMTRHFACD